MEVDHGEHGKHVYKLKGNKLDLALNKKFNFDNADVGGTTQYTKIYAKSMTSTADSLTEEDDVATRKLRDKLHRFDDDHTLLFAFNT